jgi:phosphoglycerate dehydrogenase-like enzyme
MPHAVAFLVPPDTFRRVFTPDDLAVLRRDPRIDLLAEHPLTVDAPELARTQVLVTGWGTPTLDADLLDRMPQLRGVVHSAGTLRGLVDDAVWDRGIHVCSSAAANAVPVAEFTIAFIVLAAKRVLPAAALLRDRRGPVDVEGLWPNVGFHGLTVGVVGASRVGRAVIARLKTFDVDVVVHDPYLDAEEARWLGVRRVGLTELATRSDVVTVHAPLLPSTAGMIDRGFLTAMRPGTTFVNTARGGLVDQEALADRLEAGDLQAVLDVTDPEPLPADSRLWSTPNTVLTPHLAGSTGNELRRLATHTVEEVRRFAATGAFADPVLPETVAVQA